MADFKRIPGVLYDMDMIHLISGEILSVVGNFNGRCCRARLTLEPTNEGDRLILGKKYHKIKWENGHLVQGCTKILNLPGEEHFIVPRELIKTVYGASEGFDMLSIDDRHQAETFLFKMQKSCGLNRDCQGLTGSSALGARLPSSDWDWIIYGRIQQKIQRFVEFNLNCKRELTFSLDFVHQKYVHFLGLSSLDIDNLFLSRWKYFRFHEMRISINFVDPNLFADDYLVPKRSGLDIKIKGVVTDASDCYYVPRIIQVNCGRNLYRILSWLFLYNGAFHNGQIIEAVGQKCTYKEAEYILVESSHQYIRIVGDINIT